MNAHWSGAHRKHAQVERNQCAVVHCAAGGDRVRDDEGESVRRARRRLVVRHHAAGARADGAAARRLQPDACARQNPEVRAADTRAAAQVVRFPRLPRTPPALTHLLVYQSQLSLSHRLWIALETWRLGGAGPGRQRFTDNWSIGIKRSIIYH